MVRNKMNLYDITREICRQYNIKPARSRGQNFLITDSIYDDIIKFADLNKKDYVLEVGPGLGLLAERLADKAKFVTAVELDDKLAGIVRNRLKEKKLGNAEIINKNILDFQILKDLPRGQDYKIVANLPYNITSVFLRKFLTIEKKPDTMVLMLQREVAERIVAEPPKMSLLALSVQMYAGAEILAYISRENFWPMPKVDSAIIKIIPAKNDLPSDEKKFWQLIKLGFSNKRKMLKNNLSAGFHIPPRDSSEVLIQAGFGPKIRAQELSLADWKKLFIYIGSVDK